jgi:hypothetical protein
LAVVSESYLRNCAASSKAEAVTTTQALGQKSLSADELKVIMLLVSQKILEFKIWSKETEGTLVGAGLATQGQLRKLKAGESFIDSNGQRWWNYRNEMLYSVARTHSLAPMMPYLENLSNKTERPTGVICRWVF